MTSQMASQKSVENSEGQLGALQPELQRKPKSTHSRKVGAIFYDEPSAESAVRDLIEHGFSSSRIRALVLTSAETGVIADDFDESSSRDTPHSDAKTEGEQGAKNVSGAAVGGAIGLAATVIAGFPTLGPLLIGVVAGQLISSLNDAGFQETDAQKFERGLRAGGLLITVDAGARLPDAVESLIRSGGYLGDGSKDDNVMPVMPANAKFRGS